MVKDLYPFFCVGKGRQLCSVLGLPTLLAMGADINFVKGLLSCIELNRDFPLELQPPGKGLPEGASLNYYSPTISVSVPSNLSHANSLLYHTSAKGICNLTVRIHLQTIYLLPTICFMI